jgi:hypothetical protein
VRSSLQQPINKGETRQATAQPQQMDLVQTMQMLLNQLTNSVQLNLHQPTTSAGQPIRQTTPMTSQWKTQSSFGASVSAEVPNP